MSIKIEGFPPSTAGITGALVYRGTLDPASPPAGITSAKQGDYYVSIADGTLATVEIKDGDHVLFNQDASNPLTASMFDKIDNTEPVASETVAGIIAVATNTETGDASANNKALVPSNIGSIKTSDLNNDAGFITSGLQSGDNVSLLTNNAGYLTSVASASTTVEGIIEIATNTETGDASANNKALVPSNIGSIKTSDLNNDAGFITSGGGLTYQARDTTAHSPLIPSVNYHYSINANSATFVINLPALSTLTDGDQIRVKFQGRGDPAYDVTINRNGTDLIDGETSVTLDVLYSSITLIVGSTEWEIV